MLELEVFCSLAILGKMALKIGQNGQITAVFLVIQLYNFVFCAREKNLPEFIANNGLNAGVMLPETSLWAAQLDMHRLAILTVEINEKVFDTTTLWPMAGGPKGSLELLQRHLLGCDLQIAVDDLVLARTTLKLYPVHSGDAITVYLDHQPVAQCTIGK